jgi:hypothetical protein
MSARAGSLVKTFLLNGLLVASFLLQNCIAQSPLSDMPGTHGRRTVVARRTELPINVDGDMNEEAWSGANVSLGFWQREPQEGHLSSEKTDVRILYTATTLYVGVICYDSNAAGIRATERRRDDVFGEDDRLSLILDTFHDHRSAFLFRTNPLGAQYDAIVSDEGKNINRNWDEKWEVAAKIHDAGWTVEFAIPFKSMRLSESNGNTWGIDLERVIRRKNEQSYLSNYRRGFMLENVSQAGHLIGIGNIESGLRWRVKPYLLAGLSQSVRRRTMPVSGLESNVQNASDFGLEVLKYRITPSLTADLSWNTDFAQAEVDTLQNNIERYPLFFPETREFFQEGSGIFDFGTSLRENDRELKIFHSRRIGRSPGGSVIPIRAGGRITGRLAGLTLGILNMQTAPLRTNSEQIPATNFSVARVRQDLLARSSVGAFFVNQEKGGSDDFNRVYGFDGRFVFKRYLTLDGFFSRSGEPDKKDGNWAGNATARWDSDVLYTALEYYSIGRNFRDDVGFVSRNDVRRTTPEVSYRPRPNVWHIRQIDFRGRWDYYTNQAGRLIERIDHYTILTTFQNGDSLRLAGHYYLDRLVNPFEIKPGIVIPPADYSWKTYSIIFRGRSARKLSGAVQFVHRLNYYHGTAIYLKFTPTLKVSSNLSLSSDYQIVDASLPVGEFTDHTINARMNYSFNNQWLTSTILQYDRASSFLGFNFRLNYIYRQGSDFFLIYNETRQVGGPQDGEKDRAFQTKLTYSFDF